ncbi:hypothetical protein MPSEU_000295000 [Mayamaea pseudoterrestris]|nr:hypothetical protein MPSEU_000295000 [Mayamaea pseudoterrestris]
MKRQRPWTHARMIAWSIVSIFLCQTLQFASAQSTTASNATIISTCESGTNSVTLRVPTTTTQDQVDVFFLFDDTGTFISASSTVARTFGTIINNLIVSYPSVSWGYGVGKFEDFGGIGLDYDSGISSDRPFILNQPIIDFDTAGSQDNLETIVQDALNVRSLGNGGDLPESGIEALYQVAVGSGFDGNGDGTLTGIDGSQIAGAASTQSAADASGDVPPFSSLDASVLAAGSIGGAGFRPNALKLVIIATDICSASAFSNVSGVPESVTSIFSSVPASDFACAADVRFGVVGTAKTKAESTAARSIVPLGAHTVDETVAALVSAGIQVIGLVTESGALPAGQGPSNLPAAYISAMARLTGAIDSTGNPLVYQITPDDLDGMVSAITSAVTLSLSDPLNVTLLPNGCDSIAGLTYTISPDPAENIQPGLNVTFDVTVTIDPAIARGDCQLSFANSDTGDALTPEPIELSVCADVSAAPSLSPSIIPTTPLPSQMPSITPTAVSALPSFLPSASPTVPATGRPTVTFGSPTDTPSKSPSVQPASVTGAPSLPSSPTTAPSTTPTTTQMTRRPSSSPISRPKMGTMTTPRPTLPPSPQPKMNMATTNRPTMLMVTTTPTVSAAPTESLSQGTGIISLFGRTTGALFTRGDGLVLATIPRGNNMVQMNQSLGMRGQGMRGVKMGFDNGFSMRGGKSGSKGLKGGDGGNSAMGGKRHASNVSHQKSSKTYYQATKGAKGYGRAIKGGQGRTSKGSQKVGGIFGRTNDDGVDLTSNMKRMRMTMRMNLPGMKRRQGAAAASAAVSEEGRIVFVSDDDESDIGQLKTRFSGTLIGYQAFT